MAGESGLPFVAFFDPNIVVSLAEIHLGEQLSSLQLLGQLSDKGEWIVVLDCVFVKIVVVLYHSLLSIFLRDEEYRRSLRRLKRSDVAFLGLIIYEVRYFFLFLL